ncbi:MAG: glycoside hydrolase family 66 protein [Desulfocurvibacter africanus]
MANFHPDKARYVPGDEVVLSAELHNNSGAAFQGPLTLRLSHLGEEVLKHTIDLSLAPGEVRTETLTLEAPGPDFRGYLATIRAGSGQPVSTGVDVSSTATRFPRYGYLSDFTQGGRKAGLDGVRRLSQEFHVNMYQFYDWFWRHERFFKEEGGRKSESWIDIFGRENSLTVVKDLVQAVQDNNALAMSYVMSYAARENYEQSGPISPDWGLYDGKTPATQQGIHFGHGPSMFLFDPGNRDWQDWMLGQYTEAINELGFDGLHIDQFGPRHDDYKADGMPANLPEGFASFLDSMRQGLVANNPDKSVFTFNLVDGEADGWAVREVAGSDTCDFLFSELWYKANTYGDLLRYIENLHALGGGKAVVLAGYLNYNEKTGPILEAEDAATLDGVGLAGNHAGFTGSGFVDGFAEQGDALAWTIQGPGRKSLASLVFRFANGGGSEAARSLYVNDRFVTKVRFGTQGGWDRWSDDTSVQVVLGPGENTIRLAYDEGDSGALNIDHLRLGEFDEDSMRLQNAVMFASGATHIQFGDNIQALAHEYYPNRTKSLTTSQLRVMRRNYDFITAYENLLFDPDLERLGTAEDSLRITTGQPLEESEQGRIFTVQRSKPGYDVLHLVNLMGVDNELWRDAAPTPEFQENVGVRYYAENPDEIASVKLASPDFRTGEAQRLEFVRGSDDRGEFIEFTVPVLNYWDMLFMERK